MSGNVPHLSVSLITSDDVQEGQPGLPLPAEAWLDELLASIFRMLINLESTDAKGKDHITFLMNDSSLYR